MKKVSISALGVFDYDGSTRRRGDEFDATEADARLLVLAGKATYSTRVMVPDVDTEAVPRSDRTLHLPKRKYTRRDLDAK